MNPLQQIQKIAEKALMSNCQIDYKIQKALSQIIVIARSHAESTTSNNSREKQGK
jgi:hypothetical protein